MQWPRQRPLFSLLPWSDRWVFCHSGHVFTSGPCPGPVSFGSLGVNDFCARPRSVSVAWPNVLKLASSFCCCRCASAVLRLLLWVVVPGDCRAVSAPRWPPPAVFARTTRTTDSFVQVFTHSIRPSARGQGRERELLIKVLSPRWLPHCLAGWLAKWTSWNKDLGWPPQSSSSWAVNCRTWYSTVPLNSYNGHFATMNSNGCPRRGFFFSHCTAHTYTLTLPECYMCCYCCFCRCTHTRTHDVHTMTADCWLPKAPKDIGIHKGVAGAEAAAVASDSQGSGGEQEEQAEPRDSLMTALIFGFTN